MYGKSVKTQIDLQRRSQLVVVRHRHISSSLLCGDNLPHILYHIYKFFSFFSLSFILLQIMPTSCDSHKINDFSLRFVYSTRFVESLSLSLSLSLTRKAILRS